MPQAEKHCTDIPEGVPPLYIPLVGNERFETARFATHN